MPRPEAASSRSSARPASRSEDGQGLARAAYERRLLVSDRTELRLSAALHALTGVATLLVTPPILVKAAVDGAFPIIGGVRVMGGGPFELLGFRAMLTLGWLFAAVGALETWAAVQLWRQRPAGGMLAAGLVAVGLPFWVGFALPLWPPVAAVRVILVWLGRRGLR